MPDNAASADKPRDATRRQFFKIGGAAVVGAAAGAGAGVAIGAAAGYRSGFADGDNDLSTIEPRSAPGFDHVVVVMGDNRSFDNILGNLYTPETLPEGASFDGIAFGNYSNVATDGT